MNLLAFVLVVVCGVIGAIDLFQTSFKSLVGWALVCISVGVLVQEVATTWSHSIHA